MSSDPGEQRPIPINSDKEYQQLVDIMLKALDAHIQSVGIVDSQLTIPRMMWNPLLQPCCNFPSCKCSDPRYS